MVPRRNVWSVVLAGGEGTRLASLTTDAAGVVVPKQYCSFNGSRSLFALARQRAERIASDVRVVAVVAAPHRRWWAPEVAGLRDDNVLVQPCNRGTACGVLLPLLHVSLRDPDATVVVLPSDHFVADEAVFEGSLVKALHCVREKRHELVLLGITPDAAEFEYGWIRPSAVAHDALRDVVSFVEKPPRHVGERLMQSGALWNSFVMVARVSALLELFDRTVPWLTRLFRLATGPAHGAAVDAVPFLYEHLPALDFSRTVLENAGGTLRVLPVPPCGWADLGTPQRVAECLARCGPCPLPAGDGERRPTPPVDLAAAVQRRPGRVQPLEPGPPEGVA